MLLKEIRGKSVPISINGEVVQVTYVTRHDPLSGNVSKISEARAKRNTGIAVNFSIESLGECDFCRYMEKTPEDRIIHDGGAVSVHNMFP